MSSTTIPPALYKYLSPDLDRASTILGDLHVRFSQVSVLNDFDEFQPNYKGVAPRDEIERTVRERFPYQYEQEYAKRLAQLGPVKTNQWIDEMVPEWANTVEANSEKSVRDVYAKLDSNFGLLSLSQTETSKLMWSFYSDGGRGFVIEFDPSDMWFNCKISDKDSYRHLRKVKYVADREPMYIASQGDSSTKEDAVLYTKTREWEFEEEWRIIRGFKEAERKVGLDNYGKEVWLFKIPVSAIKTVILGYRVTPEFEDSLRKIVTTNVNLKNIAFRRVTRGVDGVIKIGPA